MQFTQFIIHIVLCIVILAAVINLKDRDNSDISSNSSIDSQLVLQGQP